MSKQTGKKHAKIRTCDEHNELRYSQNSSREEKYTIYEHMFTNTVTNSLLP
jgi:hypothetical protein